MKKLSYIFTLTLSLGLSAAINAQPNQEQWEYYSNSCSDSLTLPVELLHFSANSVDGTVVLNWSTASETNNDYYTVQKSEDATNYTTITTTVGAGNSNSTNNYQFADDAKSGNIVYYRLAQTDFDGSTKVIGLTWCKTNLTENLKPIFTYTPSENRIMISVQSENTDKAAITLYTETGMLTKTSNAEVAKGMNMLNLNTSDLNNGVYICKISCNSQVFSGKVVVN